MMQARAWTSKLQYAINIRLMDYAHNYGSDASLKGKSLNEPSGQSGLCLFQFQLHEATRSISTPLLNGMLVHPELSPSTVLNLPYTWVERGTVRVKCLAQDLNTPSVARAWIRRLNQEAKCSALKPWGHCASTSESRLLQVNPWHFTRQLAQDQSWKILAKLFVIVLWMPSREARALGTSSVVNYESYIF